MVEIKQWVEGQGVIHEVDWALDPDVSSYSQ